MTGFPLWIHKILAWSVHLFTATGAIWGFLALRAIYDHEWKMAILWMAAAMVVDGLDGMLARRFEVKTYAPGIDGALLDNIVDYLNYTFVPAFFLVEAELLPASWAVPAALSILLTSAYQFSQVDAKTDATQEYFFKGFPDYWNILVIYMLVLGLNPWINLLIILICDVLIFIPIKYVYPSRTVRLKRLTLVLSFLYGIIGLIGIWLYPNIPMWLVYLSLLYVVYYFGVSLWPRRPAMAA